MGVVILTLALATYVGVGRLLAANLADFRVDILQALNARLPFAIEAEAVSGEWRSFSPVIVLTGLRITMPGNDNAPLELARGRIGVDVLNSLRTGSLQMTRLALNGLSLRGELSSAGGFRLAGFGAAASGPTAGPLREFLLNIERVSLRDTHLALALPGGGVRNLGLDLELSREGSQRDVQATLSSSAGARIAVLARGLGDPFKPDVFSGQLYIDLQSTDLGAMREMLADRELPVSADGAVDLELWFNWEKGEPFVATRIAGRDLRVSTQGAAEPLSLQRVALQARLLQDSRHWTLFVANLQAEQGGVSWTLPRLQLDGWSDALRLRTDRFALQPLNTILVAQEVFSAGVRDVFAALQPRGDVSALQLRIGDISHAADDWQLEANFEDVSLESLHGAPGATAATGYARLTPAGGMVIVDAQEMSLDFPSIYRDPLRFDELHGSLHLDWDARRVRLASGLLTTQGAEGTAKVLFALNIPLQADDIGIEMDLLVGLQDTRPVHRVKFIPYILDPALLSWLSGSIGEGVIEQGAFLWRGSLRAGATPLHTVQLAFNVADTQLSYHPAWPPVLVEQGIVLIDDSNVSVWAEQASLFRSRVDQLSVETRLNAAGHLLLDVQGSVRGPAGDGLRVLQDSPLAGIVGTTFAAWSASGELDTDLQLHMNLSDGSAPPQVAVATRWHDVDLLVMPGNLPLQSVNGEFGYSTTAGFSSQSLAGTLWGNAVSAALQQQHGGEDAAYRPGSTVVEVKLATQVDMADVRRWLQLESLGFATGEAAAEVAIRIAPDAPPLLTVTSELQGVRLDLPRPWYKQADESQHLRVEMPLAHGVMPLSLDLGEQLHLRLDVDAGVVHGGAIGINEPPPLSEEGVLKITGHAQLIQADEWFALVAQYFDGLGQHSRKVPGEDPGQNADPGSGAAQARAPLEIAVHDLRADSIQVLGQEVRNVVFNLALEHERWELALTTDWLRGELSKGLAGEPLQLAVEYLDLDRLPAIKPAGTGAATSLDIPTVDVTLSNLFQSGQRLGELRLLLHGESNVLTADSVTGELAGLGLRTGKPGRLAWHRGEDAFTELQAEFHFADLGQTLAYFDYQPVVETEGGEFRVGLRWPGAPQDFALAQARGSMQVDIGSGSFLQATAGATGALRVVSILNLADIVQRLSLSQMFESGIPFDNVQGEVEVADGMLTIARMDVQGGSSFQFSGVSDLHAKSLQGELVATLPVVNNLPWIAALAASLPVAAGVYVVSQVFNKQVNRLSSAVYTIGGTWNDPEVSFDRIFDNTPEKPAAAIDAAPPPVQSGSP